VPGSWAHDVSVAFPNLTGSIQTFQPMRRGVQSAQVRWEGGEALEAAQQAQVHPQVLTLQVLDRAPQSVTVLLDFSPPWRFGRLAMSGCLMRWPLQLKNGEVEYSVVGERETLRAYLLTCQGPRGPPAKLLSLRMGRRETPSEDLLTPKQRQTVALAVARGYYEYPRKITLTSLAQELHISKSTLSQTLMRVESILVGEGARVASSSPPLAPLPPAPRLDPAPAVPERRPRPLWEGNRAW
jgi:hypothetical protein